MFHLPATDTLFHNLAAFGVALFALFLVAQVVTSIFLGIAARLLRLSIFAKVPEESRNAFRRRIRRASLTLMALFGLAMLVGAVAASSMGIQLDAIARARLANVRREDLWAMALVGLKAFGIAVGAFVADLISRAIIDLFAKALEASRRLEKRREPLGEVLKRLRVALRTVWLCGAAVLIAETLGLSEGVRRVIVVAAYMLVAFYASRLAVAAAHLAIDVAFDTSAKLNRLESPLRYLGNLVHLAGLTKRATEYFIYVGAATWVADQLTPGTWASRAGHVGIRLIAIFYASRVVVEVFQVLVSEIFLGHSDDQTEAEVQQRRTLVPVAAGILRYGVYFAAMMMAIEEAGIDTTPLLAGAGIFGVVVGLGAQAFVGDIVGGFFILFEGLFLVGDLIEVAGVRGRVEEVGVRMTKVRDDAGVLHAIPNGEVRKVSSHSKGYVQAVLDVRVPYAEDNARVRKLLEEVAEAVIADERGAEGPPELKVQELTEASVVVRVAVRVAPGRSEDATDKLRLLALEKLRAAGIPAPPPAQRVIVTERSAG
ncbi:mechanosensitive ion channel family protein [Polyangium aurulentum]|uniref:mechanosensitive ion channel family protein n=1 Tax=Polyangium aurulentum TaxID=2567896 RepID=UPI0010AE4DCF|nr:mechanosensitive ion channel domain-containing protein [Polyangium aurulentum]UQA55343.1 mechanosensitive ion channel family protein [Polyangium aurulentum]